MTPEQLNEMDQKLEAAFNANAGIAAFVEKSGYARAYSASAVAEAATAIAKIAEVRLALHNATQNSAAQQQGPEPAPAELKFTTVLGNQKVLRK